MGAKKRNLRQQIRELKSEKKTLIAIIELQERLLGQNNPRDAIEAILQGIAPLFVGYPNTSEGKVTLQPTAGDFAKYEGAVFPDFEFDESMEESYKWPTQGMISSPNGSRADGQQMFQAGTTGPPPESAVE